MSDKTIDLPESLDRELIPSPAFKFDLSRREFCRVLGGGLLVLLTIPAVGANDGESGVELQSGRPPRPASTDESPTDIAAWIHIAQDGKVTAYTGKVEVGQDIRTSLAQAVADELRLPVESITMIMGDTDQTPFDRGTFGSRTTPTIAPQIRRAAAGARKALFAMAGAQWSVPVGVLELREGKVVHAPSNRSAGFGELTKGKELTQNVAAENEIRPASDWTVAGKSAKKINSREIVTGKHVYPSDFKISGMLYGKVLRGPSWEAEPASADLGEAKKIQGVIAVQDGNFVGVAAPTPALAEEALLAIRAEWKEKGHPAEAELFQLLKTNPGQNMGLGVRSGDTAGSVDQALETAEVKLEATYTLPYIAHVPLETRAAIAEWKQDKLTVWTGTQRPFGVRTELAKAFSIPEEKVRVIMPDTGSGYGGKHTGETAIEAARLAKAAGKPIKLVWSREEEFAWAYFRPAGVIDVRSGATRDGKLIAWDFHNWNSGPAGINTPYDVPNRNVQFHSSQTPLRQGSYRALAAPANNFARECHMDEIAREIDMDPVEFRLKNLKNERIRAVLQKAAEAFGWKSPRKEGLGRGIACANEKGGFVATCAEVEAKGSSGFRVVRLLTAFECGAVVNPDHLNNQILGQMVQALGGALFEVVHFEKGRIQNGSFSEYRLPRFRDLPSMEVVVIDRKDLPSAGAGECPMVCVAPAIANAIADATGKRVRNLPLEQSYRT